MADTLTATSPADLAGLLGTAVTVTGRENRPPCRLGPVAEYSGELLGVTVLPGGVTEVTIGDAAGARIRVRLGREVPRA